MKPSRFRILLSVKEIPMLRLFVYGSLKLGECNDRVVKPWVVSHRPACTRGFMHLRPDRYPALFLPQPGRLGTADYLGDLLLTEATSGSEGPEITGELLELKDGLDILPRLDDFEGFFPAGQSEYLRVAIRVDTEDGPVACWTYTGVEAPPPEWPLISHWPPEGLFMKPDPYFHGL